MPLNVFHHYFFVVTGDQFINFFTYLTSSVIFSSFICAVLVGQVSWISSDSCCNILMGALLSAQYILSGWMNKTDLNQLTLSEGGNIYKVIILNIISEAN